jgi:hypothetical protein
MIDELELIKNKILDLGLTLLPSKTMDNIRFCIEDVLKNNIDGDFIETGVWKGGGCIYAYHVLKAYKSDKKVFVADSFEGLPKPNVDKYPHDIGDTHWQCDSLKIDLETVKNNFRLFGELDESYVIFLKGWFKDTLSTTLINKLSVLRLDGDMYESTIDALTNLYNKLSIGGYCIIDDYQHKGCLQAVIDYRKQNNIDDEIQIIDNTPGVYHSAFWQKTK